MRHIFIAIIIMVVTIMPIMLSAKPYIIGHRGASGYEPENTLRSFKRAIEMGVDMIELDIYCCKTGELVVIHDETIDRTTNGTGYVKQLSWDELEKYDAGKGEHIPLLSEVFDLIDKRIPINIEIKDPDTIKPLAQLIKHYINDKQWSADRFLVSSFNHYAVRKFHTYCPQVKTGVIFEGIPIGYADIARRAKAQYAIMYYSSATEEFVKHAHKMNITVFAYTVNTLSIAQQLQKLGIDGIITNYPDLFKL